VHRGFYYSYNTVDAIVKDMIQSFYHTYPSASLVVTGHSLGASLAGLCTAELVSSGFKVKSTYTFGMPRVGNLAFSKWYVSTVPGTFRATHHWDPVPHLGLVSMGFHHIPYEVGFSAVYYVGDKCLLLGVLHW
jgi:predicted lipase